MTGWLSNLTDPEPVFAVMRGIGERASREHGEYVKMTESTGIRLPVGGGGFDHFVRGQALFDFLFYLRKGSTPTEAADLAKREAADRVTIWNRRPRCVTFTGKHEVQRYTGMCDDIIEHSARVVLLASKGQE